MAPLQINDCAFYQSIRLFVLVIRGLKRSHHALWRDCCGSTVALFASDPY